MHTTLPILEDGNYADKEGDLLGYGKAARTPDIQPWIRGLRSDGDHSRWSLLGVGNPVETFKHRHQGETPRLREIEGLRAVAVLAVIGNHYFEQYLHSGFLGVDVFFVISGFVITKYLSESSFLGWADYLKQFFYRRIRRLLPALLFCVALTSLVFVWVTTRPSIEVFKTGALALVGASNVFLYAISADYFSLDARLNPFTHTWSLGVEEQFYLVLPMILGAAGFVRIAGVLDRKKRYLLFPILILTSFSVWVGLAKDYPAAQFYLLPARLWELAAGCYCYIAKAKNSALRARANYLSVASFAALTAVLIAPQSTQTFTTALCVGLTALLLYSIRSGDGASRVLATGFLVAVGSLSYSLYLWHWSVLVIGRWTIGESGAAKLLCLALVLALAVLSYYCVERPFRRVETSRKLTTIASGLTAAVCLAVFVGAYLPQKATGENNRLAALFGLQPAPDWDDLECHGRAKTRHMTDPLEHCLGVARTVDKPNALYLIGDSHAAHLYWMVHRSASDMLLHVRFANLETDFPYAMLDGSSATSETLDYIVRTAVPGDIVLISIHRGRFNEHRDRHIALNEPVSVNSTTSNFVSRMRPYLSRLGDIGVKVILIKDTPLMRVVSTSSACALQVKMFGESICRVSRQQDLHTRYRSDLAFDELAREFQNTFVWDPAPSIYGQNDWLDVVDPSGNYLMQDWNHISRRQSELLATDFRSYLGKLTSKQ